jgi:predicted ATPase/DNA-binding CsgD family transcriptional regulator
MGEKQLANHNLPYPLARFIGRKEEIADIQKLLSGTRLLTLTGIGGSGKTRLAIEIASQLVDQYPGGVWLVELGELSDPSFIQQAIVTTFGLYKEPGKPLMETLVAVLKPKRLLLVLDNCEHLIEACAQVSQTLLSSCPLMQILATSRESLQIPGEISWQVLPLSLPGSELHLSPQVVLQYTAIQLFVDRARAILPSFSVTKENVSEVVQVCRRLEGIPLALELAAAWVNVLPIDQISERLGNSLQFLVRGGRTAPLRQQTLRATLDWSFDLLSEKEKALFWRLALFVSDFSLSAAESICFGNGLEKNEILGLLSQLVSKSLLRMDREDSQEKRFRLLEVVRQYSLEKLSASKDEEFVKDSFLDYYLTISEMAKLEFVGPQQGKWVTILEQELSHLRTALHLSQEQPGWTVKGLRLMSALDQFWQLRGYLSEGSKWLEELLLCKSDTPPQVEAAALFSAGFLAYFLEDYDRSNTLITEARDIYQQLGDDRNIAHMIINLASNAEAVEDFAQSKSLAEQSLAMFEEMGESMGIAIALFCLGDVAYLQKDLVKAESSFHESLEFCRKIGNQWAASRRLARLGQISCLQGHFRRALEYLDEGLVTARDAGDKWGMVMNMAGMAELVSSQGKPERTARLLAGSQAIFEVFSTNRRPIDRALYENCENAVKTQLGDPVYQAICSEMHSKTPEQIVEYALAGPDRIDSDSLLEPNARPFHSLTPLQESKAKYGGLTARERQVAMLVAQGKSNASIAEELFVGVRTVEAHITRILTKLNFTSRTQIAGWAIHRGLASPPE